MSIKLKGSSDGSVSFDAPADTSPSGSDITLTLPTSAGSADQFLKNSGIAGELEYSSMVETSTGIGIGTSAPVADLHVKDSSSSGQILVEDVNGGRGYFIAQTSGEIDIYRGNEGSGTDKSIRLRANDSAGTIQFQTGGNTERMRINSAGEVETTAYTTSLVNHLTFNNPNGEVGKINTSGTTTFYNTSSDYRLKENVVPLEGALDRISNLQVKRFNFIVDPTVIVDGFIAHEAQAVVPECVTGEKDAVDDEGNPVYQGIDQSKLVPLLTAALQEAIAKIETLETKVAALEAA